LGALRLGFIGADVPPAMAALMAMIFEMMSKFR
jgi:hypothetical protein